jgi:hypothetical protein
VCCRAERWEIGITKIRDRNFTDDDDDEEEDGGGYCGKALEIFTLWHEI